MPHRENNFTIRELHPSFAAEISGLDFSQPIPDSTFEELLAAIAKVRVYDLILPSISISETNDSTFPLQYGVIRFPQTGLDDARHVAFAAKFGELDDITPHTKAGKKHRLDFPELFDVSNLLENGAIAPLDSHRSAMNKVRWINIYSGFPLGLSIPEQMMILYAKITSRATISSTWTVPSIRDEPAIVFFELTSFLPLVLEEPLSMRIRGQHSTTSQRI